MENCSVILFHYDGNVDGWVDLSWNNKAIHIVAQNQTKWYIILQTPFKKFIFLNPNSKIYDTKIFSGGLRKDFCIRMWYLCTTIYFCGMRILVLIILTLKGTILILASGFIFEKYYYYWQICFRYLEIMLSEGLEISQPALDPNKSTDIHHRITVRNQRKRVHRWSLADLDLYIMLL